ncbi:MAG: 1-acyl-sn-glycerol-3-phosphate acyltransferase [Bdellovibrionaceae bacterium]|nr:1-acyl-sn-glycerol-3-phosphate acyltransferase [Pseudobdellovibrionaceae bacterium]|tara:strand:- start:637 stop:1353 length:717 start_codon:yes stop_codon:yes gene_type:complete
MIILSVIRLLFVLFWLCFCCAFSIFIYPFLFLFSVDFNAFGAYLFGSVSQKILGLELELEGFDQKLPESYVLVANHQSALDVVVYAKIYPQNMVCIGKKEIRWIPFFGWFFWMGGNLFLDRKNQMKSVGALKSVAAQVRKEKKSVWIFPEGTRNTSEKPLLPFKKGAFHLAIDAGIPVVPWVSSRTTHLFSSKNFILKSGKIKIKQLQPIPTTGLTSKDADSLLQQVREIMLNSMNEL